MKTISMFAATTWTSCAFPAAFRINTLFLVSVWWMNDMVLASLIPVDHHKVADCRIIRHFDCSMAHFPGYFGQHLRFNGRNPIQFLVLRDNSCRMQVRIKGRLLREPVRESQILLICQAFSSLPFEQNRFVIPEQLATTFPTQSRVPLQIL